MATEFLEAVTARFPGSMRRSRKGSVLCPHGTEEVAEIVRLARGEGVALAVPGGPKGEGRIPLRLSEMSRVIDYDEPSQIVRVETGISLPALGDELRRRGRTLSLRRGVPSQSLCAFLARGAQGARSKDDDPVAQLVTGLKVVLPDGRILAIRSAPRRAVGPDLLTALVGARGKLGVITEAELSTRPRAPRKGLCHLFPSRREAEAALAQMRGLGVRPESSVIVGAPEGYGLLLELAVEGARLGALCAVASEEARRWGGVAISEEELPPLPRLSGPRLSPFVEALAARLDPEGILTPRD